MNSQGPWAPLEDKASITVDKGVRESQSLNVWASELIWPQMVVVAVVGGGANSLLSVWASEMFGFLTTFLVVKAKLLLPLTPLQADSNIIT